MSLWSYIKAVGKHWWALMSCALFTFLGVYILHANRSNQWAVNATFFLAAFCLLVACFLAWKDEHTLLIQETTRNQKPDIEGEIIDAFIGPVSFAAASENSSVVLFGVKAWNKVQMPDVTIRKYELKIQIAAGSSSKTFTGIQEGWRIHHFVGQAIMNVDISREGLREVRYLNSYTVPAKLGFYVDGMPASTTFAESVELTLIDLAGGKHTIERSQVTLQPDLKGFPRDLIP